jgi:large repetitive protein
VTGGGLYLISLESPVFSSSGRATFDAGNAGSFDFSANGTPSATFSETGKLPAGLTLSTSGVLSGTPGPDSGGRYPLTITAANGVAPSASQAFTLDIDQAPALVSAPRATFRLGVRHSYTVRTLGFPAAQVTEKGKLPRGLRFVALANGTATISGRPAKTDRRRTYVIWLRGSNGVGSSAVQRFTLRLR